MPADWSPLEVEATVADYFDMLEAELRGLPYNKLAHLRALTTQLSNRTKTAVERKRMNISAVLRDIGHPWIDGFKPLGNYQHLLYETVAARLNHAQTVATIVEQEAIGTASVPDPPDLLGIWESPPEQEADRGRVRERPIRGYRPRRGVHKDYLALEASNRSLGRAGEELVLRYECTRLRESGAKRLADRIEHTSAIQGDGLGYDILSFESDGRERLIEVKTTSFGRRTPFFVTRTELSCSKDRPSDYYLYRLYDFRRSPRLFGLPGPVDKSCLLSPAIFEAQVA
jgi:hypothetical protein